MVQSAVRDTRMLTPKGQATRERIVSAAADLIVAGGLSALSMETLRRHAAVSGSQFAHYFADKRELIGAVLSRQIEVVLAFHRQPKLNALQSLDDFERWLDLNLRYLRRIGYTGTPTYHALAAQLAKSDEQTRAALADGYQQWISLFEGAITQLKRRRILTAKADAHDLALVLVATHQGSGSVAFAYREDWPLADGLRFAVNRLRSFATDPAERVPRPARRTRRRAGDETRRRAEAVFTRKGLATRARIVDATATLMYDRGVAGTSMDDVRRAAGVSGSQLSHYFGDKRDLIREVVASRREQVRAFHTKPAFGGFDSIEALQDWADTCIADIDAVYRRGGCVYGSLAGELTDADDQIHGDLAGGYQEWIALFIDGLEAMRRRGELVRAASPPHLAAALVIAHQGGAMLTHVTGDAEPLRVNVNAAVDYVRAFRPAASAKRR